MGKDILWLPGIPGSSLRNPSPKPWRVFGVGSEVSKPRLPLGEGRRDSGVAGLGKRGALAWFLDRAL